MSVHASKIIWSADLPWTDLLKVIDAKILPPEVMIKLDQAFFTAALASPLKSGKPLNQLSLTDFSSLYLIYKLIGKIHELGHPIFIDWKMSEIPSKTDIIGSDLSGFLPSMLNCMAGSLYTTGLFESQDVNKMDGLKRYAETCKYHDIAPCAVTVLTSKDDSPNTGVVFHEFRRRAPQQVLFYARLLVQAGFTDMVCSPQEADLIRENPYFDSLNLNCPGIRLPGSDTRDQKRIMTPRRALELGINRLVIGSDITGDKKQQQEVPDPVERIAANWQRLNTHLEGGN